MPINPGRILSAFAAHEVDCLLIGGMNFFLRHRPVTTFDVNFWIRDETENLERVTRALTELGSECEYAEGTWGPVPSDIGWLRRPTVPCLTSPEGAIDLFQFVQGLGDDEECRGRSVLAQNQRRPSLPKPFRLRHAGLSDGAARGFTAP